MKITTLMTTKIYDVIQLNNHLYVVDKETRIETGHWTLYIGEVSFPDTHHVFQIKGIRDRHSTKNVVNDTGTGRDCDNIIIATTDASLGLPLLPDIDDVEVLAEDFIKSYFYPDILAKGTNEETDNMKNFVKNWINNIGNPTKARKYTEKDMRNAFLTSWVAAVNSKILYDTAVKELLVPLLKSIPKQVELEAEEDILFRSRYNDKNHKLSIYKPKTKDNFVIVKQWL